MDDFKGGVKVKQEAIQTEDEYEKLTSQELDTVFELDIEESKPGPFLIKNENEVLQEELMCRNKDLMKENENFKPGIEATSFLDDEKPVITKSDSGNELPVVSRTQESTNSNLNIENTQRKYICNDCGFTSQYKTLLRKHSKSSNTLDRRCNLMSDNKYNRSLQRPHNCPHCDYAATQKGHLRSHIQAKHMLERPHQCPQCDYSCVTSGNLERHIKAKHTLERPHQCPHCYYAFTQKGHLKSHIQSKHTLERPHQCPHCEFAFTRKGQLKTHIQAKHNLEQGCPNFV